jgi:hypothetical protein
MTVYRVECRSDHDYIGRPLAFEWQGKRFIVDDVLLENRTPAGFQFKVRTADNEAFELDYEIITEAWTIHQL